jgi:hypothetical protein
MEFKHLQIGVIKEVEFITYGAVCFFVPFFLAGPQVLVGSIVNMTLALSSGLKGNRLLAVSIFPSLGLLARGAVFGPFTPYLLYMLPFIWIANIVFAKMFGKNAILGVMAKAAILFSAAFVMVKAGIIPALFLAAMVPVQLLTAGIGAAAGKVLIATKNRN